MALSRHHVAAARPLSVQEIVVQAQDFEFGPNRSLKNWLRSAQLLTIEAGQCEQDGDLQMAYLYLYRHAELVLGKLPTHPEYKKPEFKQSLVQAQKTVQKNLTKLEQWKPRINQQQQRYAVAMERRNAAKQRVEEDQLNDQMELSTRRDGPHGSFTSADSHFEGANETLHAHENRQLAVEIAQKELRRRKASRDLAGQTDPGPHHHSLDQLSNSIREAGRHLVHHDESRERQSQPTSTHPSSYNYPTVPAKEQAIDWKTPAPAPKPNLTTSSMPPLLPAKGHYHDSTTAAPPTLPPKAVPAPAKAPSPPPQSQPKYTFKPAAKSESGAPLRTVMLPPDLRTTFLNLAHPNTLHNLETCGILCGTLISNALFISHLIIPDQHSTSDTCDTTETGDAALFDYCDAHALLVCGWIHTHPSQSCFLSSRDLHTSSGYQVMLPEAIAIVCAPRHNPDWGVFRLTDPPGLEALLNCEQKSTFHPHQETRLYTDALRPGHVVEGPGLKFEVVDLRVKKS